MNSLLNSPCPRPTSWTAAVCPWCPRRPQASWSPVFELESRSGHGAIFPDPSGRESSCRPRLEIEAIGEIACFRGCVGAPSRYRLACPKKTLSCPRCPPQSHPFSPPTSLPPRRWPEVHPGQVSAAALGLRRRGQTSEKQWLPGARVASTGKTWGAPSAPTPRPAFSDALSIRFDGQVSLSRPRLRLCGPL